MVEPAGEAHVDHIEGDGENGEEEDFDALLILLDDYVDMFENL